MNRDPDEVVGLASADMLHTPEDDARAQIWRSREPASVALLHARSNEQARSEAFAEPLKQATGVWISGGRQGNLSNVYVGTPVERELAALLQRGGVIGGTSAGPVRRPPAIGAASSSRWRSRRRSGRARAPRSA